MKFLITFDNIERNMGKNFYKKVMNIINFEERRFRVKFEEIARNYRKNFKETHANYKEILVKFRETFILEKF